MSATATASPAAATAAPDSAIATIAYNPATGEILGQSRLDDVRDLPALVARARAAQATWEKTPVRSRSAAMLRIRDYIVAHADELAETISRDNGKTRADAMATEIVPVTMAISYYARKAPRFLADRRLMPGNPLLAFKLAKIARVPFGVIGIIAPWNYPFAIPFSEVVMGVLAGNAVILKTATETQLVGRALAACMDAAGLPEGLFTFVNLPGRLAGDALLENGIDKLFFTGSVGVGKKLMAKAAETLTPVSLELGGNDAMIVCADADLERAAAGATWAGMQNAGQSCGGVERIYVEESVYEPFLHSLAARVRRLRVGYDDSWNVDMGAITTKNQLNTIREHVAEALAKGAKIYAQSACPGGNGGAGLFHPAMVLTEVDHTMRVMCEETFGPVVGVMKVRSIDEAIELANDSNLGLTGSVWSRNRAAAEKIARRIRAGVVMINDHLMSHGLAETPWGGFKESGIGRTHGDIGFAEMTEPQCIVHDYLPGVKKNMWWYPQSKGVYDGLKGIANLLYGSDLASRAAGLGQLLRLFPRTFRS